MSILPEEKMKSTLLDLIDEVGVWMSEAKTHGLIKSDDRLIVGAGKFFLGQEKATKIIEKFIEHTCEFWDPMIKKDESHFKKFIDEIPSILSLDDIKKEKLNNDLFKMVPDQLIDDAIDDIKSLAVMHFEEGGIKHDILNPDRKDTLWKISHSFIKFSIQYIHTKRKWSSGEKKYTAFFSPQVKLKSLNMEVLKLKLDYS